MAPRVIVVREMNRPMDATNVVTLRVFTPPRPRDPVDLVASAVVPSGREGSEAAEAEITAAVSELLPFAERSLQRVRSRAPRWDVEDLLADPPPGGGWPGESEVRLACRQPVYALERCGVAASLGFDGDLLLRWRRRCDRSRSSLASLRDPSRLATRTCRGGAAGRRIRGILLEHENATGRPPAVRSICACCATRALRR
jgi:hypothetical protein